jgi:multiple sugar transport system permease protein
MVIAPVVLFYVGMVYLPIVASIGLSLTDVDTFLNVPNVKFVAFNNYRTAFSSPLFWTCLKNTFYFALLTVPLGTLLGLALAMVLFSIEKARGTFRSVYFIPVVTSMVAVSIMWKWLYQPRFGLINQVVDAIGLALRMKIPTLRWLDDPKLAMPCLAAMTIWKGLGFNAVIFMAGLSSIPGTLYEAARVDGAGRLQLITKITLPLVARSTAFVLVTGVIGALQVFTQMYVMTKGGPIDATRTLGLLIYNVAFVQFLGGYSAALSVILFVIILVLSVAQLWLQRTTWEY